MYNDNVKEVRTFASISKNKSIKAKKIYTESIMKGGIKEMEKTHFPFCVRELTFEFIDIPAYQRPIKEANISRMMREFDELLVEMPILNYNTKSKRFEVIDGQHTIELLTRMGYNSYMFKIYVDLTLEERTKIFVTQYTKKNRLSTIDAFNALLSSNMDPAVTITKIADKYDLTIAKTDKPYKNITSVRKLEQIFKKYGSEGLEFVFMVLEETPWTDYDKMYIEAGLNIGYYAYPYCLKDGNNYEVLRTVLSSFDSSTEFMISVQEKTVDVSSKHPEYGVRKFIEDLFA